MVKSSIISLKTASKPNVIHFHALFANSQRKDLETKEERDEGKEKKSSQGKTHKKRTTASRISHL